MLYKVVVTSSYQICVCYSLTNLLYILLGLKNYPVSSLQVKESLSIPVVANGDIKCESDVRTVHQVTGVNGKLFCTFWKD